MGGCCSRTPTPPAPPPRPPSPTPPVAPLPQVQIVDYKRLFGNIRDAAQLIPLVDYIERLLSDIKKEQPPQSINPDRIEMHDFVKECVGGASQFLEDVSAEGKSLHKGHLTSTVPEGMGDVISRALEGLRQVQLIAVAFSVIAFALQRIRKVSSHFDECVELLDTTFSLAKRLQVQHGEMVAEVENLKKAVIAIIEGVITCCSCMTQENLFKYLFASTDAENLKRIEDVHRELSVMTTDDQAQMPPRDHISEYKAPANAVGIDHKVAEVIKLLDMRGTGQRRAVLLHGFGGVGKTTLADCVMSQLDFTGFKHSKIQLDKTQPEMRSYQEELFAGLTKERLKFKDCNEGRDKLKAVLKKESIFVFIDNVLSKDQINNLLPSDIYLRPESRMLFTSPKISVAEELRAKNIDCKVYHVGELSNDVAKEFFRKIVLRSEHLRSAVETKLISLDQINAVAEACRGVPLLLRVYAHYLARNGRDPNVYDEMLHELRKGDFSGTEDHLGLGEKLEYIYEQLRQDDRDAFVDVCTYFHGWPKKDVSYILTKREFDALVDGALVDIDSSNKIVVHDLLRALGIQWGKESRVRSFDHWKRALEDKKEIRGMWTLHSKDVFNIESQHLNAVSESLRVLAVGGQIRLTGDFRGQLRNLRYLRIDNLLDAPGILDKMDALKYIVIKTTDSSSSSVALQRLWGKIIRMGNLQKFALDSNLVKLPDDFRLPESLRELDLNFCRRLQELPHGLDRLNGLQALTLRYCQSLRSLPHGFSTISSLQSLDLFKCESLESLPDGFGNLSALQSLDLEGCWNLTSLPDGFGNLTALQSLNLRRCRGLASLSNRFGNISSLQSLDLRECESLASLPDEFGDLSSLQSLKMGNCGRLSSLPTKFGHLSALQSLDLSQCRSLVSLPNAFGNIKTLKSLDLEGCTGLVSLPNGFGNLSNLQLLNLQGCSSLTDLPHRFINLSALKSLNLQGCKSIRSLPSGFGKLRSLQHLNMDNCFNLKALSDDFECLRLLEYLNLSNCHKLEGNAMQKLVKLGNLRLLKIIHSTKLKMEWENLEGRNYRFEVQSEEEDDDVP